jgi:hypothetical protein
VRLGRDLGLALVGGFAVAIAASYAIHGRLALWIGLAVGVLILVGSIAAGRIMLRSRALRPGSLFVTQRDSPQTGTVSIEPRLSLANKTACDIRYRAVKFSVEVEGVRSDLQPQFEGLAPSNGEAHPLRNPITFTMPTGPVDVVFDWTFYYGRERTRRFRFERSVSGKMSAPMFPPGPPGITGTPITVKLLEDLDDRRLTPVERRTARAISLT